MLKCTAKRSIKISNAFANRLQTLSLLQD
uniref:Uncharacterized protein n=1 Tax=Anguilla anguilla TaxID=7936 RepID=A0A0E9U5N2_ANGAN